VFDRVSGTSYSQALFVVLRNQLNQKTTAPMTCMIQRVERNAFNTGLGSQAHWNKTSVFTRLGLSDNGVPIKLKSHMFRHFLGHLAQSNGVSDVDLAKWRGSSDLRQNFAYDHESAAELLARTRTALAQGTGWHGPLKEFASRSPVARDTFSQLAIPTAHTSEIGYCVHDYAMAPCQINRDCIHCTEHICIKGDRRKTENVRRQLEEGKLLLERARAALGEKAFGTDRWCAHHQSSVERLETLLGILEDPSLPEGTIVQLGSRDVPSALRAAAERRRLTAPGDP
jgi:hypothetical protein